MLHELRVYAIPHGRMPDIEARMLGAVPALFAEHGIRAVGHWVVLAGPRLPSFIYLIEWSDAAERESRWDSFYADERWWHVRAQTNAGSELVETYMLQLFRPNRRWTGPFMPAPSSHAVHDLVINEVAIGRNAEVADHLVDEVLPYFTGHGAQVMAILDTVAGPVVPSLAYWLAWPDYAARTAGWRALHQATELRSMIAAQRALGGRPLLGMSEVYLLDPVPSVSLGLSQH